MSTAVPPCERSVNVLPRPKDLRADIPLSAGGAAEVLRTRDEVRNIIHGRDPRRLVIVGPCSVHDPETIVEYAEWLRHEAVRLRDHLVIVMRVFVEKSRTSHGWKGLLHDPQVDGEGDVFEGLRLARTVLRDVQARGVGIATEILDPLTAPFIADLASWVAVGARTVTSPPHRWMASGLECPIGFKNALDGDVSAAVNAVLVARESHERLTLSDDGRGAIERTAGNPDAHVVLRGGPVVNYDERSVALAANALERAGLGPRLLVDCSHGNNPVGVAEGQLVAAEEVSRQIRDGSSRVAGILLESYLASGSQRSESAAGLDPRTSATDACVGLDDTRLVLEMLARV